MREVWRHRPGRVFLVVIFGSWLVAHTVAQLLFGPDTVVFGWMTSPVLIGISLMVIWLVAFWVYVFKYWPFR